MISFWEKKELLSYDLVVLGGGITGIFCALSYRERFPEASIAILERGLFSSGASTKNAGFACFGSLTELIEDIEQMNESEVYKIIQMGMVSYLIIYFGIMIQMMMILMEDVVIVFMTKIHSSAMPIIVILPFLITHLV